MAKRVLGISYVVVVLLMGAIGLFAPKAVAGANCPGSGGDCCTANGSPGCDNVTCCECVCAIDPFCCDTSWDGICASEAANECQADCGCAIVSVGACCFSVKGIEFCEERSEADCGSTGGSYLGDGTTCDPDPCGPPQVGACCLKGCFETIGIFCIASGGDYQGDGTTCDPDPCGPPSNDDCNTAIGIPVPGSVSGSTVGAGPDTAPFCGTGDGTGGGVWYSVVGTGNMITATTCETLGGAASYDSKIRVYCDCADMMCVVGNDDLCVGGPGLHSTVTWCSAPDQVYDILVHGFGAAEGSFTLAINEGSTCADPPLCTMDEPTGACCPGHDRQVAGDGCIVTSEVECLKGLGGEYLGDGTTCDPDPCVSCVDCVDTEGEPDGGCVDGYVDTFNAGCNSDPATYSSITCGETVCGLSGTFIGPPPDSLNFRDTDWYLLSTITPQAFTWEATGDEGLPIHIAVIDVTAGCGALVLVDQVFADPCNTASLTTGCLPPGDYAFFVAPQLFQGLGCGLKYTATLTCGDTCEPPTGACCALNDTCSETTLSECLADDGLYLGDGTTCDPDPCAPPPTGACCLVNGEMAVAGEGCIETSELECLKGFGGDYQGDGTTCDPNPCAVDRVDVSKKGSLVVFPDIELKWSPTVVAGPGGFTLTQDTFLAITNDYPDDVYVHWLFVDGDGDLDAVICCDPPQVVERAHDGWTNQNWTTWLTHDQSTYFSLATGLPEGAPPFANLDMGVEGPGRPDIEANDGSRYLRGFALVWAVDQFGNEISWNHLAGSAVKVNYAQRAASEYNAYSFQATAPLGDPTDGTPGQLLLDGVEYDIVFDLLLLDFYSAGATPFSKGGISVMLDTDLTLLPMEQDLRQETNGPVHTKVNCDIWNQNEDGPFSGTERCIWCWDQTMLSDYDSPNHFLMSSLHTDKGKARVDGIFSGVVCGPDSEDAPLLGVAAKLLAFSGTATGFDYTAMTLVGQGNEAGFILADIPDGPGTLTDPNTIEDAPERIERNSTRSTLKKRNAASLLPYETE